MWMRSFHQNLVGSPGLQASTDIYNALVDREVNRHDGTVYLLKQLASRKPPETKPNWRTTYRFKCSTLIAVERIAVTGEPLSHDIKVSLFEQLVEKDTIAGHHHDSILWKCSLQCSNGKTTAIRGVMTAADIPQLFLPSDRKFSNVSSRLSPADWPSATSHTISVSPRWHRNRCRPRSCTRSA